MGPLSPRPDGEPPASARPIGPLMFRWTPPTPPYFLGTPEG